jgi:hypothetical protein
VPSACHGRTGVRVGNAENCHSESHKDPGVEKRRPAMGSSWSVARCGVNKKKKREVIINFNGRTVMHRLGENKIERNQMTNFTPYNQRECVR